MNTTTGNPQKSLMELDSTKQWLLGVRHCPSPNCDHRPPPGLIDLVVIHGISLPPGEFGGPWIDALFTNTLASDAHPYFRKIAGLRISAHVLIRRDGEVVQYTSFQHRAWHAGRSEFAGRGGCNDFSIGIELEGTDDTPYAGAQYARLACLTTILMQVWPSISRDRIVGHCDISPGRKSDPGEAFDWERFHSLLDRADYSLNLLI